MLNTPTKFSAIPLRKPSSESVTWPRKPPCSQADCAALAGLDLGASGWALAPGAGGPASVQKAWTLGEECFSARPGPPSPIAAPCGHRAGGLRALSQTPMRASASFVGHIALIIVFAQLLMNRSVSWMHQFSATARYPAADRQEPVRALAFSSPLIRMPGD